MAATHDGAHSSTRTYWTVGVILAIVTAIEVVAALPGVIYDPAQPDPTSQVIVLIALLIMMLIKGALVAMFFMHLKGDSRIFLLLFLVPLLMATSMFFALQVIFANHGGIAG
jgi:cytochrome c oxidase subunit 4